MASGIVESSQGSGADSQSQGPTRSKLVQRLLAASENLPAFINDLLTTQAVSVAGTEAAAFLIERGTGEAPETGLRPIAHIRPDESPSEVRQAAIQAFQELIRPCVEQGKDGAIEVNNPGDGSEAQFCLVTLLRSDGQMVAVSAVITRCRDSERARQRLMSMQLVAGYFDLYTLRRTAEQTRLVAQSHQQVLQLAGAVATAEGFDSAGTNLCNELATRSGAARVSLGWVRWHSDNRSTVKVRALSHTEKFDKKQELIVALQRAMEECVDQEEVVQYDPSGVGSSNNVTRFGKELSRAHGGHIVLSLPLRRRAQIVGVMTLEFPAQLKLGENVVTGLSVAVDLLAPQLYDRYQNDRWLITKAALSVRELGRKTIGPKHMLAKLIGVIVVAAVLVLFNWVPWVDIRPMYRVSANLKFVPIEKRTVSAPYDGRLEEVFVRPGQTVKVGDKLAQLDTRELEVRRIEARKEVDKYTKQADMYRGDPAEDKLAEAQVAEAERGQAEAKLKLVELQIAQATIVSDIDGEVLSGDWTDKRYAPLKQGDTLFEVAQPHKLRAELMVADRDVQWLTVGQAAKVATSGLPQGQFDAKVERIVPMGVSNEGANYFTVYAELTQADPSWAPGLTGQARIEVQRRSLAWIWTHRVTDWLRLKLWI